MTLDQLNQLSREDAAQQFLQCCTAERWLQAMADNRPFPSAEAMAETANDIWATMAEADFLQAFEGHPKIGDVSSLKKKYAHTKQLAAGEQASVNDADDQVIEQLAQLNQQYDQRFGFIFIVCATGKSAAEMLAILASRIDNDRETELKNAAEEQRKILQIRLTKLLSEVE